ncbi:MAG: GNAT family N-acetyltransferase [Clostridiales bacterium]|nr:GNAT family N-acetyltransferase [Candidatus Equinaster intestinalis]
MNEKNCIDYIYSLKNDGKTIKLNGGILVPFGNKFLNDNPDCINLMNKWRIENPQYSSSRFPISYERTYNWAKNALIEDELRILFFIQDNSFNNIGHIGISNFDFSRNIASIDSAMRGVKGVCPGIMGQAIEKMKDILKNELSAETAKAWVSSDNERSLKYSESHGFVRDTLFPMRKLEKNGEISWETDMSLGENAERYVWYMICRL